jgi:hypothetical protein
MKTIKIESRLARKLVDLTFVDQPKKRTKGFDAKKFMKLAEAARKTFSDEDLIRYRSHYWCW